MMDRKQALLHELEKEDAVILSLAYIYAHNFHEYGVDVTKTCSTALDNVDALDKAYQKGYHEGWDKAKENILKSCTDEEKEEQTLMYKFEIGQIVGKFERYPNHSKFKILDRFVINLTHPYYKLGLIDRFFNENSQEIVPNHYQYVPESELYLKEDDSHIVLSSLT